jgi:hypothetical protein
MIVTKRNPRRAPAFLKAVLQGEDSTQEVCVRDVSVNGALLEVLQPLRVFEMVTLTCGNSRVNGIVAWCDEGRLGMEFSELLTGDTLVDSLEQRMKISAPRSYQGGQLER